MGSAVLAFQLRTGFSDTAAFEAPRAGHITSPKAGLTFFPDNSSVEFEPNEIKAFILTEQELNDPSVSKENVDFNSVKSEIENQNTKSSKFASMSSNFSKPIGLIGLEKKVAPKQLKTVVKKNAFFGVLYLSVVFRKTLSLWLQGPF